MESERALIARLFPAAAPLALSGAKRGERWIGTDEAHVYMVPLSAADVARLGLERSLLEGLRDAGCPVPDVVLDLPELQVRTKMRGVSYLASEARSWGADPPPLDRYAADLRISMWGRSLARDFGATLARVHGAFAGRETELEARGLRRFRFSRARQLEGVKAHLQPRLVDTLKAVLLRYEASGDGPVIFSHGDLGHHNLCCDEATGRIAGIFDFGDSCLARRELDFKFAHTNGLEFVDLSVTAYEEASGVALDRRVIADHHILEAVDNVVYASTHPHHGLERCVGWAAAALERLA